MTSNKTISIQLRPGKNSPLPVTTPRPMHHREALVVASMQYEQQQHGIVGKVGKFHVVLFSTTTRKKVNK